MFNKFVASVLFLSVISSSAFAASFKKGDKIVCDSDNIQITFLTDAGPKGANVLLDLGDGQAAEQEAQVVMGSALKVSAKDCPDETQCWEMSATFRTADIQKGKALRVLLETRLNGGKTNFNTLNCAVK